MTVSVETEYHRFDADRARAMEWLMDALVADGLVSYERLGDLHKITHSGLLPSHDNIMTPEPSNEYQKLVEAVARDLRLAEVLSCDVPITTAVRKELEIARAALSDLKLPHGDDGWQDISTAPKDGTPFLAYNPMIGVYNTAFTTRWTGDPDETGYEGFPCGFWHLGDSRSYPFGKWDCVPTHWRPLPTPPAGVSDNV